MAESNKTNNNQHMSILIDELKRHRDEYTNDYGWNTSVLEALDTAITILEAERRKNNGRNN